MPFRDDDHAELDEREFPEPDDEEEQDVASLVECLYCRKFVHEEAPRCHHCGNYHSREDAPSRKPWWLVIGVLVCLLLILFGIRWG
jgi:hypothetical protein